MDAEKHTPGGAEVGADPSVDADRVIPVVVGATLESERFDRPIAERLASTLNRALGDDDAPAPG